MVLLINRPLNKTLDYSGLLRVSVLPFIVTQQTGGDDQAAGVRPGDGLELIPPSWKVWKVKSNLWLIRRYPILLNSPCKDYRDVESKNKSDWDQVSKCLTVNHHILKSCLDTTCSENHNTKFTVCHLVLTSQEKSVGERQTEVEDHVKQQVVPNYLINACLP